MLSVLLMAPALVTPPRASSAVWRERMRAQRHIRPHVNPLQRRFQLPAALDLEDLAFAQSQPIHVDVGCGKGHFCADLAEARPDLNVLGIEIRDPLVEEANRLCMRHMGSNPRPADFARDHSPHATALQAGLATHTLEPRLGQASSRAPEIFASWRAAPT
jgi:SAM-dependent methyltransferase